MESSQPTFAEALNAAHTALLIDLRDLDEAARSASGEGSAELGTYLGKVRTHLLEHFRFEEQDGYMAPVLKEEPRLGPAIQELLAEHGQLARVLDALIQEVGASRRLEGVLLERVRGWVKQVRHHETQENNLVYEAYYSSGATGD
jgi:hypothetical protein